MRYFFLLFWILLSASLSATSGTLQTSTSNQVHLVSSARPFKSKPFKPGLFFNRRKHTDLDILAIVAIGLEGLTVVLTLLSYLIWGSVAAGFVLAFSSVFTLAGMILGAISLIRAIFRGWRRGTIWAAIALGIPLLFLLFVVLLS